MFKVSFRVIFRRSDDLLGRPKVKASEGRLPSFLLLLQKSTDPRQKVIEAPLGVFIVRPLKKECKHNSFSFPSHMGKNVASAI